MAKLEDFATEYQFGRLVVSYCQATHRWTIGLLGPFEFDNLQQALQAARGMQETVSFVEAPTVGPAGIPGPASVGPAAPIGPAAEIGPAGIAEPAWERPEDTRSAKQQEWNEQFGDHTECPVCGTACEMLFMEGR